MAVHVLSPEAVGLAPGMVSRMMRWRPWPPLLSKKFRVRLVLRRVEGVSGGDEAAGTGRKVAVEVRWKGPKLALSSLRRTARRNRTREEEVGDGGVVELNEEFGTVCTLTGSHKESSFQPWEITFIVLNLALSILESRSSQFSSDMIRRRSLTAPLSPPFGDVLPSEKDELSALKAGLRRVKILTEFVSTLKSKKTCQDDDGSEGKCSARSDDAEYIYPSDLDSPDDELGEVEDTEEDSSMRKSFSYGTLQSVNNIGNGTRIDNRVFEDWVSYNHRRSDVGRSHVLFIPDLSLLKRSILPWKKRKLSFRSPKPKGEPLLKKAYEEGGDDIDYDRRQLSSSDESVAGRREGEDDSTLNRSSVSNFGDDYFVIGNWETKELVNRDGHMKLVTQVFFASIDQRSERAGGESACTALVAVIADWFHRNQHMMPIKSQFDSLIRQGSLEWRNLCENRAYQEHFPDKHFDLETVLGAKKIGPISVVPSKSFIGFFHPDSSSGFDFLRGAMSFDSIWDEISRRSEECSSDGRPLLYIVSWNDHFFVLKVEHDAYYILDTLGERLSEGCQQAYILKFDDSTSIHKVPSDSKTVNGEATAVGNSGAGNLNQEKEGNLVCRGKESCKEYIKSFLAAIPIRELQADINQGRVSSTPLHHRLQIEFHYTESSDELSLSNLSSPPNAVPELSWPIEPAVAFTSTPAVLVA
ncbi:hypothetical protein BHM03_00004729 [Ensete ventricosum]|nr:hypothetical protein BHM03_00004729 [Ensete ventricosum]